MMMGLTLGGIIGALANQSLIDLSLAAGALISSFAATSLTLSFIVYKVFTGNVFVTLPIFTVAFITIWFYIEVIKKKKQLLKEQDSEVKTTIIE